MNELSGGERQAIVTILSALPRGRREGLLADLASAEIGDLHDNRSVITFMLPDYDRPSPGQMPVEVEGLVRDDDDEWIDVVIYEDANRRLYELELIRHAKGSVRNPDWASFRLKS